MICKNVVFWISIKWNKKWINSNFNKRLKKGSYKPCTHPHPPTITNTYPHPAKNRSHLPTFTPTQPKKGHTHPHPPTPSLKKVIPTHTDPYPAKKRSHLPTPTHTQQKKGHTHVGSCGWMWPFFRLDVEGCR